MRAACTELSFYTRVARLGQKPTWASCTTGARGCVVYFNAATKSLGSISHSLSFSNYASHYDFIFLPWFELDFVSLSQNSLNVGLSI